MRRNFLTHAGDVIQIGANATRLMKPWGNVLEQVTKISSMPKIMSILDQNRKVWLDQDLHTEFDGYPNAYGKRGAIQRALYDHAIALGVEVNFNAPVVDIFEDGKSAGVVLKGGSRYEADLVIAADGVRGQPRKHVVGVADRPQKSGFAVFRSSSRGKGKGAERRGRDHVNSWGMGKDWGQDVLDKDPQTTNPRDPPIWKAQCKLTL